MAKTQELTNDGGADVEDDFDVLSEGGEESLIFNLEEFEAPKFQVAPPGTYDAVVKNVENQKSKAGNDMWVWQLEAADTPVGKRVFFNHMVWRKEGQIDPIGMGRIKAAILAVNPEYNLRTFSPLTSNHDMIGLPCRVKVAVGKYNGEDSNNVKDILPPDEGIDGFLS
jgi:hypothetical protein